MFRTKLTREWHTPKHKIVISLATRDSANCLASHPRGKTPRIHAEIFPGKISHSPRLFRGKFLLFSKSFPTQ